MDGATGRNQGPEMNAIADVISREDAESPGSCPMTAECSKQLRAVEVNLQLNDIVQLKDVRQIFVFSMLT